MSIAFLINLTLFAAYNDGAYGTSIYGDSTTTSPSTSGTNTSTQDPSVLAPLTGFIREQPPYVVGGLLIFFVVACVLIARFAYSRLHHR